jgi:hypothetical protein
MSGFELFFLRSVPKLLTQVETDLEKYFDEKVAPLRRRLRHLKVDQIPEHELRRAFFVLEYGGDRWRFIRAVQKLTPYQMQHLRSYIDRGPNVLH